MYARRNLGFAVLPFITGAIEVGKRLLSTGSSGCERPVEAFRAMLASITPAEKADWIAYVRPLEARPTDWSGKIMSGDAAGLAWEFAGGDDCRTTSANGKLIVAYTTDLLGRVEARVAAEAAAVPGKPDYYLPGIEVTVPRGAAQAGGGLLALALVGGAVLLGMRKGRRRGAR